jgi:hypothetical protein
VVYEENTLIDEAEKFVQQAFLDLGNSPQIVGRMIEFLSTHSRDALIAKGINNRNHIVLEIKRSFTKRNLIQQTQNKCIMLRKNVDTFNNRFDKLVNMGLPTVWGEKGKFLPFETYKKHVFKVIEYDKKFKQISDVLSGQIVMNMLVDGFYVLCQVKELFVVTPTYEKYTDLDIAFTKNEFNALPIK